MILTIDTGNTNTVLGCFDEGRTCVNPDWIPYPLEWRISMR